jgi:hypothetical protein
MISEKGISRVSTLSLHRFFMTTCRKKSKVSAQPLATDVVSGWVETSVEEFFKYFRRKLSMVNLTIDQITRGPDHSEF